MKRLKALTGLMLISLMATSCLTLDGQLDVKQMMAAKKKSGFLNLSKKEIEIKPDLYRAELKIDSEKSYTLKLNGHEQILIPIKANKNSNIPSNGRFSISHNDIAQPFDLKGEIATDVSESPRIDTVESCSRVVTENHCRKVCDSLNVCRVECKDELVTIYGRHEVSYHYRTTRRDLSVDFLKADKPEVLANFRGSDTQSERITDYSGFCR